MTVELVAGLVGVLGVVFATFAEDVGADVQGGALLFCLVGTQQSASDFDANGNLLNLNHIGTLHWHYNNTLGKLSKPDKTTIEYYGDYLKAKSIGKP
jgi:hypothetical protein